MKKNYSSLYVVFLIGIMLFGVFYFMMPQNYDETEAPLSRFSTKRALEIVKEMSAEPHYVGSENHEKVAQNLVSKLKALGLQTSIQEGFTMTEKGTLVKSKNILTRIKGTANTKALVLLSHYDSAPHSFSHGASDDASGVATILEGIRAFLYTNTPHKNDIIILFTDAEELGLNGAALFVTQHHWAKEVGLVLNFEARGSSGPSYMLMETNKGNAKMVESFSEANVDYPVSNSLMYSIYKMLPNDTDLTVFREKGKIQGFNFAFIDNHFNYHTAQDQYENLDPKTLAHQGSYLMPLLNYFSNANLSSLDTTADKVYFNVPFGFMSYPFEWIIPMLIVVGCFFIVFVFIGLGKRTLKIEEIIKGIFYFFGALLVSGLIAYFGWQSILIIYPQYNDILQGFTYNGHDYILGFVSLTLSVCFLFYKNKSIKNNEMSQMVFPLLIWLVLNGILVSQLKGASFFIIPVFFSVLMMGIYVIRQKTNSFLNVILAFPALVILVPFISMFPVGLGLKVLVGSAILTVLTFVLLLPVFGSFSRKGVWSFVFFMLSIGLFYKAHQSSGYVSGKAKPNSLLYVLNSDKNKAYWTTYDTNLDQWTKNYLGENPQEAQELSKNRLYSKYGSQFTFMKEGVVKKIPKPTIEFLKDSIVGNQHFYKILITPNRKVNRYDVFANEEMTINNLKANGVKSLNIASKISGKTTNKILTYYVVDNIPLELEFSIDKAKKLNMTLNESSFDLLTNPLFDIPKRPSWMIPTPFVLNDAVVIIQKIRPSISGTIIKPQLIKKIKKPIKITVATPVIDGSN